MLHLYRNTRVSVGTPVTPARTPNYDDEARPRSSTPAETTYFRNALNSFEISFTVFFPLSKLLTLSLFLSLS